MLMISCSTSSSLLSRRGRGRRRWESGNGAGPKIGLGVWSLTSSRLPSSTSEPWFEIVGFCEATLGRHDFSVALETQRRVTKIKETRPYV